MGRKFIQQYSTLSLVFQPPEQKLAPVLLDGRKFLYLLGGRAEICRVLPPNVNESKVLFAYFFLQEKVGQGFPSRANIFFLYASTPGWLKGLTPSTWPLMPQDSSKK